jgi:TIR domain/Bacterial SH3 domain
MPAQPSVFISYRRSDSSAISGRIYDRLTQAFGKARVFKDSYNIAHGADFREVIETNVLRCNVVLVIIGPTWLTVTEKDDPALRRLDDPGDWVRFEIETGLNTPGTTVIPVLVQNAHMPQSDDLPESLRKLAYKNATVVRDDPDFDTDVARLIQGIVPPRRRSMARIILSLLIVVVVLVAALIASQPSVDLPNSVSNTDAPRATTQLDLSRTPNSLTGLVIGGQAKVNLSNGFPGLPVFNAATNQSPKLVELPEGDIVTILDGPVQAIDQRYFVKIRTSKGIEGWAFLYLTDTLALLPIIATATPQT